MLSSILAAKLSGGSKVAAQLGNGANVLRDPAAGPASPGGHQASAGAGTPSSSAPLPSPEDIIRCELIRLQREGLLLSPADSGGLAV
jgi:hypothetical protein